MTEKTIGLDLPLASLWTRFLAFLLDCLILIIPGLMMHVPLPFAGPLLVGIFYYPILHASPLKATLGKKAFGIQVVDEHGHALSLPMAFLRYGVAVLSSCLLFVGHALACFTPRKQALHDLVADSFVVNGEAEGVQVVDAWVLTLRRLFGRLEEEGPKLWGARAGRMRDRLDELERLHQLKEKGILSEAEYERLKQELI